MFIVVLIIAISATIAVMYYSSTKIKKQKNNKHEDFYSRVNHLSGRDSWDDNLHDEIY